MLALLVPAALTGALAGPSFLTVSRLSTARPFAPLVRGSVERLCVLAGSGVAAISISAQFIFALFWLSPPLAGAQSVLATYAKQILESIQRDGFYVRVPAGKQFYLYVMQTIDRNEATVGGSRLTADDMNEVPAPSSQTFVSSRPPPVPTTQGKKP